MSLDISPNKALACNPAKPIHYHRKPSDMNTSPQALNASPQAKAKGKKSRRLSEADLTPLGYRRRLYARLRAEDESDKWPVSGAFNVTERAIRRLQVFERACGVADDPEGFLENEISAIVNGLV